MKYLSRRAAAVSIIAAAALSVVSAASADNLDRRMRVNNYTGLDMTRFYASNRDADTWQEDMLGNDMIRAGDTWIMNFDDGTGYCIFDFRAEFEDGQIVENRGINVCKQTDFTYQ